MRKRIYAHINAPKKERGHSFRVSPDGNTVLVGLKNDTSEHRRRLRRSSIGGVLLSEAQARSLSYSWNDAQ